jgi:hypothetical protein
MLMYETRFRRLLMCMSVDSGYSLWSHCVVSEDNSKIHGISTNFDIKLLANTIKVRIVIALLCCCCKL